jgi:hypothetical protein
MRQVRTPRPCFPFGTIVYWADKFSARRLEICGHRCLSKCHSDQMHRAYSCPQRCHRIHTPCGHSCPKACGESCGRCLVQIPDFPLLCGHVAEGVNCYETANPLTIRCMALTSKTVPGCLRTVTVPCHLDVGLPGSRCDAPCTALLGCGHTCSGSCSKCTEAGTDGTRTTAHVKCKKPCGRGFTTCNHFCSRGCHGEEPCGLCELECKVCLTFILYRILRYFTWLREAGLSCVNPYAYCISQVQCPHSKCPQKCGQPCVPCIQTCKHTPPPVYDINAN